MSLVATTKHERSSMLGDRQTMSRVFLEVVNVHLYIQMHCLWDKGLSNPQRWVAMWGLDMYRQAYVCIFHHFSTRVLFDAFLQ